MTLFERILAARGIVGESKQEFLSPDYSLLHDPFLLPDMQKAVDRLIIAHKKQEKIVIYGDYDIDGLTATTLLNDALFSFGFKNIDVFIPNRFIEGYGLTVDAIKKIADSGAQLIITVDCGSSGENEINAAKKLGVDVIVTDHHSVPSQNLSAVASINPKYIGHEYPFTDLSGVGVAFKLVQALQSKLHDLPTGHEKWLLDLVALGTVCDIVPLIDENRIFVHFGIKVLSQTKRPGLKALMAVSGIDVNNLNTKAIGFGLGPRMNAAGRLDTAQHALDVLLESDPMKALEKAQYLNELNKSRKIEQGKIVEQAKIQAEEYKNDAVLVVSSKGWNHGIVGIVAAKLLEIYKKPTVVLEEMGEESKGSARSFGDLNMIDAINSCKDIINKGGGHQFAAGLTLPTKNIGKLRIKLNKFYKKQNLINQESLLLPKADADAELDEITIDLVKQISTLEPFGIGNPQPIIKSDNLIVTNVRKMGTESQHVKIDLKDKSGKTMQFIAFGAPKSFFVDVNSSVSVWFQPNINEWQSRQSVEGQLLHIVTLD